MTPAERAPAPLSAGIALFAGALALVFLSPGGFPAGAFGLLALAVGIAGNAYPAITLAGGAYLLALALAGLGGASPVSLLSAGVAAAVAWDAGANAVEIGRQVGRGVDTRRVELRHSGATALAGLVAAGAGLAVYRVAAGGRPVAALALLLLAAVLLASALR